MNGEQKAKQIRQYYSHPGISQSEIKRHLATGVAKQTKETSALSKGKVFDVLTLIPEAYKYLFVDWDKPFNLPTGKVKDIVDKFYKIEPDTKLLTDNNELLIQLIEEFEYYQNLKLPSRIHSLVVTKHGQQYHNHLRDKGDRDLVPGSLRGTLYGPSQMLRSHLHEQVTDYLEIHPQYPVYFNYLSTQCKGLIDLLVVYADRVEVRDVKYTELSINDYNIELRRRRTDIQLSYYKYAIKQQYKDIPVHCYVDIYSKADDACFTFKFSELDLEIARYGAERSMGTITTGGLVIPCSTRIKGWHEYFEPVTGISTELDSIWM